jgi:flavin reductase (DIM6/NTAB) family NADH-FMN oxidoreductase RutF
MIVDVAQTPVVDVYHMLVGLVNPRPIAWVSTVSAAGVVNLAPFSFFNAFGANPPVVVFSPTLRRDGTKKDTLLNIEATREFVVNVSVAALAETINLTAKEIPAEQSEVDLAQLHTLPSLKVKPPRIQESPAALECRVIQILPVGNGPISANLVIGEVLAMHIRDDVLDPSGRPDPFKLQTISRLGGEYWGRTTDLFELKRP